MSDLVGNPEDRFSRTEAHIGERGGRALDSESRGPGFDLHWRNRVLSLSKTH